MKNKIISLLFLVFFAVTLITIYLLIKSNDDYKIKSQSIAADKRKLEKRYSQSLDSISVIIANNNRIIKELRNSENRSGITGFTYNDKNISLEGLLKIVNNTLEENRKLKKDSRQYKEMLDFISSKYGITSERNDTVYTFKKAPDPKLIEQEKALNKNLSDLQIELEEKKFLLKHLEERYGFKYNIEKEDGKIKSTIYISKLDSALWLFPFYKHKIRTNKKGETIIR